MSRITNKHIIKIKELISDEVCLGTLELVELELLEMEKDSLDLLQNTSSNSDYEKCGCGSTTDTGVYCQECLTKIAELIKIAERGN